ncbi:MAG: hypothetical protein FWC72_02585, partial [Oscillospiraceae bacterium]|nr:hypothetical protein [Oscillospiraceae bacterium]
GTPMYRFHRGGGSHLIAAALAADNRTLAILTMTETGGQIQWYTVGRDEITRIGEYRREDELFFDLWFTSRNGDLGVISNNQVLYLSPTGEVLAEYDFTDRHLRAYDTADGQVALHLTPSPTGGGGDLVVVAPDGQTTYTEITGNLFDLSLSGRYLAALFFDEILIYRGGRRYARFGETEGMTNVLMRRDGTAFRLSPHRARLLVP